MTITLQLTDGTTTHKLKYSPAATDDYKWHEGAGSVGDLAPRMRWHRPDDFPAELIDAVDDVRQAMFTVTVQAGSAMDDPLNAIHAINRLGRQAARAKTAGDADEVYLVLQRDGATNQTEIPVLFCYVDDSRQHYSAVSIKGDMVHGATVVAWLEPYGRLGSDITLKNELPSSPHMIEDSNADGTVDNITNVGSATLEHSSAHALIGGLAQRFITDSSTTQGIRSATVSGSPGAGVRGKVYVALAGNDGDPLTIRITDDSVTTVVDTVTHDPANPSGYARVWVAKVGGLNWYEYHLNGTVPAGASGVRMDVRRDSGDATQATTAYVDGMYLETGGGTDVPDGYMSAGSIDNRYDPTNSNPGRINYIDVWGIPGDAPALVRHEMDWTVGVIMGANTTFLHAGRALDGNPWLATEKTHWIEDDDVTSSTGTSNLSATGNQASASRSDGHYRRWTASGGVGSGSVYAQLTGDSASKVMQDARKVVAICRSASTDTTVELFAELNGLTVAEPTQRTITDTDSWEAHTIGIINLRDRVMEDRPGSTRPVLSIGVTIGALPNGDTFDLDALLLLPIQTEHLITEVDETISSFETWLDGIEGAVVTNSGGIREPGVLGSIWELEPGDITNRIIYLHHTDVDSHALTDAADVTLDIRPRVRHMIGDK